MGKLCKSTFSLIRYYMISEYTISKTGVFTCLHDLELVEMCHIATVRLSYGALLPRVPPVSHLVHGHIDHTLIFAKRQCSNVGLALGTGEERISVFLNSETICSWQRSRVMRLSGPALNNPGRSQTRCVPLQFCFVYTCPQYYVK